MGALHQGTDRSARQARRDAALVHREEHRHPALQERSFAERSGNRQDRQVGRQRRAGRQSGRHAAADPARRRHQVDPGRAGSGRVDAGDHGQGRRAGLVGRTRIGSDRAHRRSLGEIGRDARSERHSRRHRRRTRDGRRALRVSSHDLDHHRSRAAGRARRRRRRRQRDLADSRSRPQCGYFPG